LFSALDLANVGLLVGLKPSYAMLIEAREAGLTFREREYIEKRTELQGY